MRTALVSGITGYEPQACYWLSSSVPRFWLLRCIGLFLACYKQPFSMVCVVIMGGGCISHTVPPESAICPCVNSVNSHYLWAPLDYASVENNPSSLEVTREVTKWDTPLNWDHPGLSWVSLTPRLAEPSQIHITIQLLPLPDHTGRLISINICTPNSITVWTFREPHMK